MSRRVLLATALAATLAGGLPLAGSALANTSPARPANTPGLVATATRALRLDLPTAGVLPPSTELRISVAIPARDPAGLRRLAIAESTPGTPVYRRFLSPSQVRTRFSPTPSTVQAVESWLRAAGFRAVSAEPDRLLVDAQGSAAVVEHAFHTGLQRYRENGRLVFANTAAARVPASLGRDISAVLGLENLPLSMPHLVRAGSSAPDLTGFYPRTVQRIYDANTMAPATRTSIAIVAAGGLGGIIANLRYAETHQHFAKVPVSVVYTAPKDAVLYDNPYTGNLEFDLDTQISTMVAGAVRHLYIYDGATIADEDVARAINLFVSQDQALLGSASLGECDYLPWADGAMLTTDQALEEGALQGQSFFASSGDNGFACPEVASTGAPGGVPGVSWPADGTWTVGVGGTSVLANSSGQVSSELAWVGGGGGISQFEVAANWTLPASAAGTAAQFAGQGGRPVPDIAADADPNVSPVLIYTGGGSYTGVGGTSVASPLSMGLFARVQSTDRNRLGLAALDFYRLYAKANPPVVENTAVGTEYVPDTHPGPVAGFRDITEGSNGVWPALPGYDNVTGLGSIQAAALARALR